MSRKAVSSKYVAVALLLLILIAGMALLYYYQSSTPTQSTSQTTQTSSINTTQTTKTTQSSTGPVYGGTLVIDVSTDKGPPGDPMTVQEGPITGTVQQEVYEGLTAIDFNGNVVPDLATNWTELSPTDFIFSLRQNVYFQDGTPFNSSAVVFSFTRILNNTQSPRYGQVSNIQSVKALGNYKVEFKLKEPDANFLESLAIGEGIVSPTAVAKYGNQFGSQYAVGTGPYKFIEWVQNDHVTLQANQNYWGQKPYIQTVIIRVVPDPSTRVLQLLSGQAQVIELTPDQAKRLSGQQGAQVVVGPPNEFITISINVDPKYTIQPLLNPLVRQAINYAINRTAIVNNLLFGYAVPGIGPVPPSVLNCWNPSLQVYPPKGDPAKAKQLLVQAGYQNGFNVKILTAPFTANYLQVTEAVASDLQKIGINASIDQESFSVAAGQLLSGNGTWQLAFHDWGGIGIPSAYGFMGEFYNENNIGYFQWNLQHIRDDNLTSMLLQLRQTEDPVRQKQLCDSIQSRILSQAYGAILYYPDVLHGVATTVKNYKVHPNPWYGFVVFNPVIGAGVWLSSP
jgi:peptide/nickel transport system substrate-binding protein